MATKREIEKWELYLARRQALMKEGFEKGLVKPYSVEFIERLRTVYYGGLPASILLLSRRYCNGYCYDRALLAAFGVGEDDFQLVDADIDGITLNPEYVDEYEESKQGGKPNEHYGNHCFLERVMKDGSVWVYDTTLGMVFDRDLYYRIEHPKITKINDRSATEAYIEYQDIKGADIERDKYVLPGLLPLVEAVIDREKGPYKDVLKKELELFKEQIGYKKICEEVAHDMERLGIAKREWQFVKSVF